MFQSFDHHQVDLSFCIVRLMMIELLKHVVYT
jgi:hypothetical protein